MRKLMGVLSVVIITCILSCLIRVYAESQGPVWTYNDRNMWTDTDG